MAKFKTRARAVDMLGRQQIAGIPTAISELFKNAHDAYAHFADVDYFRADDIFILRDDGIGMTENDFLERWLAIGTESKVGGVPGLTLPPRPKGQTQRPMLGEKGIGRLAVAAIGPQVLILTRAIRTLVRHSTVAAFINWGIFETPGLNLDEIEIPVVSYEKGALPSREDVLALVDLFRDNVKLVEKLKQRTLAKRILEELELFDLDPIALDEFLTSVSTPTLTNGGKGTHFLILPTREALVMDIDGEHNAPDDVAPPIVQRLIGFTNTMTDESKPQIVASFRVHRPSEAFQDLIGASSFFTADEFRTADHHFRGEFDEYGQFNGRVTIYNKKPVRHTLQWTEGKGAPTKCGSFRLNLAYVQGNAKESLLPAQEWVKIKRKLDKIGGLYIYKNGIRVLPYGSSDYDFLDLERARTKKASTGYFSYRRMFGYVEITADNNPQLSEKAGREGFRENAAYKEFKAILKNFFRQMAADFFRESGLYAEAYVEIRGELKRQNEIRRLREQQAKEKREQFAKDIEHFFEKVESGLPTAETAKVREHFTQRVQNSLNSDRESLFSAELLEIENDARLQIEALRDHYRVEKPSGFGLTTSLRRDWELYKEEYRRLDAEVFQPTLGQIVSAITDQAAAKTSRVAPKQIIQRALKDSIAAVRQELDTTQEKLQIDLQAVNARVRELVDASRKRMAEITSAAHSEFTRSGSAQRQEAILGEFYKQEATIAEATRREQLNLTLLGSRLKQAVDSALNADDLIEALEEENLALAERSEADVELATLGIAVSVIGHEFRHTVGSMRDNLNRLKGWADVNKDLRALWRDIRADFEHLDAYLELFIPLQQRLYRKKVIVTGSGIEAYLRRLFGERFERERVELRVSHPFRRFSFTGYPSTFYPVFVNLVDNSLYWLRDRSGEKVIQLGFEGGSTFVVSDNGPGIPKRDRDAIFERGFTRKPAGRGMGLKISQDVLAREDWELVLAEPQLEKGATFKIRKKSTKKGAE